MKISIILIALGLALSSSLAGARPPARLRCEGAFAPDSSHERIVKEFGANNVSTETRNSDSANPVEVTILYPTEGWHRLEITWNDHWRNPRQIRTTAAGEIYEISGWRLSVAQPDGLVFDLEIGSTWKNVEEINQKPIGNGEPPIPLDQPFDGWNGGKLSSIQPSGCHAAVWFRLDSFYSPNGQPTPTVSEIGLIYD